MILTETQVAQYEAQHGESLKWMEVTAFGDPEAMFLLVTPSCRYCGVPNPSGHCKRCGASVLRQGVER